jgi:hypothetical protein
VSGDIDCDKIDYVARDAYYAGLPVSADLDRLLSQLSPAALDENTVAHGVDIQFGAPHPDVYYLLAIRPAGTSALEIFVMTRSYLFERIYTHHKVRAAERALERILRRFLTYQQRVQNRDLWWCLNFMLDRGGDDAVLSKIASWSEGDDETNNKFRSWATALLDRQLPQRALAISLRTLDDYAPQRGRLPTAAFLPWSLAYEVLAQRSLDLEDLITKVASLSAGDEIYVDWTVPNPVRENPEIWVKEPSQPNTLLRVNRYFDVEQLSNAYRDVKMTGWVFSTPAVRVRVAAATAFALHKEYDLVPGPEATRRAKVSENSYQAELRNLSVASSDREVISNLLNTSGTRALRPPMAMFLPSLGALGFVEDKPVAERLSKAFSGALPRHYYDDLQFALVVMSFLLQHCVAFNRHGVFADPVPYQNERRFQEHLRDYLRGQAEFTRLCNVVEHAGSSGGETDLIISSLQHGRRPVIVELKSAQRNYEEQYDAHAGQPLQYAEENYGRVTFLYCQYASEAAVRVEDTIQVRQNSTTKSPQMTICIGQWAFAQPPSAGGATTTPIGDSPPSEGPPP